jgi:hypothetical protein
VPLGHRVFPYGHVTNSPKGNLLEVLALPNRRREYGIDPVPGCRLGSEVIIRRHYTETVDAADSKCHRRIHAPNS